MASPKQHFIDTSNCWRDFCDSKMDEKKLSPEITTEEREKALKQNDRNGNQTEQTTDSNPSERNSPKRQTQSATSPDVTSQAINQSNQVDEGGGGS